VSRFQIARLAAVLAFLASAACAAPAAAPAGLSAADRAAIQQVTTEFVQNVRAANFAAVGALYTADGALLPPNGPAVTGRAAIQAFLESFPPITDFNLTEVTVDGSGDVAFVHGTYSMTLTMPDGMSMSDSGKSIEIRRRQADGRWLITHDIFNSDVPLPMP